MKKNLIDKVLLEWSYRCDDGIVDLNDPKKFNILKEMLGVEDLFEKKKSSPPENSPELPFKSKISPEEYKKEIIKLIDNAFPEDLRLIYARVKSQVEKSIVKIKPILNKTSGKNIESLYKLIYNVALDFGEYDELINYLSSETPKPSFDKEIIKSSEKEGNIINLLKKWMSTLPPESQLSEEFIRYLLKIDASIKGTSVGKGEIALILLFGDTSKGKKRGDLQVGSDEVEIKGYGSRLVTSDKKARASKKDVLDVINPFLDIFDKENKFERNKDNNTWLLTLKRIYDSLPPEGKDSNDPISQEWFKNHFSEKVLTPLYGNLAKDIDTSVFLNPESDVKAAVESISKSIALAAAKEYMVTHNTIFLFNPENGDFTLIKGYDEFKDLMDTGKITKFVISGLFPQIYYGKVSDISEQK